MASNSLSVPSDSTKVSEDLTRAADVLQSMQAHGDLADVSLSPNIPPAVFGAGGRQGNMSVQRTSYQSKQPLTDLPKG
jgi:hypothetical protein